MMQRTIFVVDDDAAIRTAVSFALTDEGYLVATAEDGRAALNDLRQLRPDLILLDMRMPIMDGWEFAQQYRRQAEPRAPIVVLTAAQDAADWAAQIQANGYLAKPFGVTDLLVIVDRHLRHAAGP
jgi:two-component system chemotaxis response regulator CheY